MAMREFDAETARREAQLRHNILCRMKHYKSKRVKFDPISMSLREYEDEQKLSLDREAGRIKSLELIIGAALGEISSPGGYGDERGLTYLEIIERNLKLLRKMTESKMESDLKWYSGEIEFSSRDIPRSGEYYIGVYDGCIASCSKKGQLYWVLIDETGVPRGGFSTVHKGLSFISGGRLAKASAEKVIAFAEAHGWKRQK